MITKFEASRTVGFALRKFNGNRRATQFSLCVRGCLRWPAWDQSISFLEQRKRLVPFIWKSMQREQAILFARHFRKRDMHRGGPSSINNAVGVNWRSRNLRKDLKVTARFHSILFSCLKFVATVSLLCNVNFTSVHRNRGQRQRVRAESTRAEEKQREKERERERGYDIVERDKLAAVSSETAP